MTWQTEKRIYLVVLWVVLGIGLWLASPLFGWPLLWAATICSVLMRWLRSRRPAVTEIRLKDTEMTAADRVTTAVSKTGLYADDQ
jgi:hypothetical protein